MIFLAIILAWIVCGFFVYGKSYGFWRGEFGDILNRPKDIARHRMWALIGSMGGPLSIPSMLLVCRKHGFKWL